MQGGHDSTHAALIGGNGGKDDALRKDAFLEESVAKLHCQRTLANNNRRDGRLALDRIEAELFQATLKEESIFPELLNQAAIVFQQVQCCYTGGNNRGRMRGAEQHRASALQQVVLYILATGHIAAQRADA